jgi:hypothetical protein
VQHRHGPILVRPYSLTTVAGKHSPKILAAIETLAQAGKNSTEIREALLAGVPGHVKPVPEDQLPPKSTIVYHARRAKRELEPVPDLDSFTNALEQSTIRVIRRDMRRIEKTAEPSERDFRLLALHNKTLALLKDRARAGKSPQQRGGEKSGQAASPLERIARQISEAGDGAEPVADDVEERARQSIGGS